MPNLSVQSSLTSQMSTIGGMGAGGAGFGSFGGGGGGGGGGTGFSNINFFGIRSKSQHVIIVLDVSQQIMGGAKIEVEVFQLLKEKIAEIIAGFAPDTTFNLIVFDGSQVNMFAPKSVPAESFQKSKAGEWIRQFNKNISSLGARKNNYNPKKTFPPLHKDTSYWLGAIPAALEQAPDTIFLMTRSFGPVTVTDAKSQVSNTIKAYYTDKKKPSINVIYFMRGGGSQNTLVGLHAKNLEAIAQANNGVIKALPGTLEDLHKANK